MFITFLSSLCIYAPICLVHFQVLKVLVLSSIPLQNLITSYQISEIYILKIKAENPYVTFFTGDFNAHSQFWWPNGGTNLEGGEIDDLFFTKSQIISEATNFEPGLNNLTLFLTVVLVLPTGNAKSSIAKQLSEYLPRHRLKEKCGIIIKGNSYYSKENI